MIKGTSLTPAEMIIVLRQGTKLTRISWPDNQHMGLAVGRGENILDHRGELFGITELHGWYLWKEKPAELPKPKLVERWQWVYKYNNEDHYFLSSALLTEPQARSRFSGAYLKKHGDAFLLLKLAGE